jgi:lipoyl(octanoyl) transferase
MIPHLTMVAVEGATHGIWNMALDEALFRTASAPVIRFYRWAEPTVSLGYFTSWSDAHGLFPGYPLVRRWTGGGIVEHGADLTFALILPGAPSNPASSVLYRDVHTGLVVALQRAGYDAVLASRADSMVVSECFRRPVEADVLVGGRKVAGAAIRRHRQGVLLQGSIQGVRLDTGFPIRFAGILSPDVVPVEVPVDTLALAGSLVQSRYGQVSWTRRR